MRILDWLADRFWHSDRRSALSLYRRGMTKAKKHEHQGAIQDYSDVIQAAETPVDVTAMALYNRALAYLAAGDESQAVADLNRLLAMDAVPVNVKTMARQKIVRMASRSRLVKR